MGLDSDEDLKRKPVELCLAAGRNAQNPHSGYIQNAVGIPTHENLCFVLALLRSRLTDNILEGKTLLERLLAFEIEGNFPVYLHEFPQCKDRQLCLDILPVVHWLLSDFRSVLGEPLSIHLEMLVGRILSHGYKMHRQRPLARSAEFRLKSYFEPQALPDWTPETPDEWADALISYQMALSRGIELSQLFEKAKEKWHPYFCAFVGAQFFERGEPRATLFDLFMGHYHGVYSKRALNSQPCHLLASVIQPFSNPRTEIVADNFLAVPSSRALYWGSKELLHSFALDGQKGECQTERLGNALTFFHSLPVKSFAEGDEALETAFFINREAVSEVRINGTRANTFQLGDTIELVSVNGSLQLVLSIEEGEGRFFGHISRANRPSQRAKDLKYEVFDWQIALRTIRRSEQCRVKAVLGYS